MFKKADRSAARVKRHLRVRKKVSGTTERPRLAVFRSEKNIYAQIIDDVKAVTLVAASSKDKDFSLKVGSNKEAAKAVGEKSIEMIKSKELLPLTGYIHGGCSPIGMKKFFTTTFHSTAADYDTIMFSAGKIGHQVEVNLRDIEKVIRFQITDIVVDL